MINRINQVMELADGKKYVVVKQAIYKFKTYYVCLRVTDDEENVLEELVVFEEVDYNNQKSVQKVKDQNILKLVLEYVGLLNEESLKSVNEN